MEIDVCIEIAKSKFQPLSNDEEEGISVLTVAFCIQEMKDETPAKLNSTRLEEMRKAPRYWKAEVLETINIWQNMAKGQDKVEAGNRTEAVQICI